VACRVWVVTESSVDAKRDRRSAAVMDDRPRRKDVHTIEVRVKAPRPASG